VDFPGVLAKLKYASGATLTNNGFVAGDYLAAGSAAGMTGDLSSYFDTGCPMNVYSTTLSLGVYYTATTSTDSSRYALGGYDSLNAGAKIYIYHQGGSVRRLIVQIASNTTTLILGNPDTAGFALGSYRDATDLEGYLNGVSKTTYSLSDILVTSASHNFYFMGANNGGNTSYTPTDCTVSFGMIGSGLTDTEAGYLSSRVNALMTALGCNVY